MRKHIELYENGIKLLVKHTQMIDEADSSDESKAAHENRKREMKAAVIQLKKALLVLEDSSIELMVEDFHLERGMPDVELGHNGWLEKLSLTDSLFSPYEAVVNDFRDLTESVELVLNLMSSRIKKRAFSHAAMGFLHLRYDCGFDFPALYDEGEGVLEFKRICIKAGIHRSNEACRNALSSALKRFDPYHYEEEYSYLFQ